MNIEKSLIYTKGGDKGKTALLGGRRVSKYHHRIEAYGTVDELMAHTALLRDLSEDETAREQLLVILERLMSAASVIAADGDNLPDNMPSLSDADVEYLEQAIDVMDHALPKLTSFILPGGHPATSQAHVARTVCRRAERIILKLQDKESVDEIIIRYFNRLSDYYFLLSRKLSYYFGAGEIPWKP
ncbi:MAG: cob(I)yrinic acid a,c-diamide adenosyltransferase [Bacteroidales bacterium]|nr:cob(I)yrinic acid a,c-diamide adenosyltransferase [Bacteroidales bacterium]